MYIIHKIIAAATVSVLIAAASVGVAWSQAEQPSAEPDTSTQQVPPATSESTVSQRDLQQRIEQRKNRFGATVSDFRQSQIRARCVAAQERAKVFVAQISEKESTRQQRYEKLAGTLSTLQASLQANDRASDSLDILLRTYTALTSNFMVASAQYSLAAADIVAMPCEQEPAAFQITLDEARSQRDAAKAHAEEIRLFLQTELKPALLDIQNNL